MRIPRLLALLVAILIPAMAMAHGPSRQKVTVSTDVAATPAEVWAVIGNFHDMSWYPGIVSTEGEGGNTIGANRLLTLGEAGGPTILEELTKYDAAKMSYSYIIKEVDVNVLPVTNYSSHLTVIPKGTGSTVEWRGAFYRGYPNNDPPANLNDEAAVKAVTGVYQAGLDALKARFGAAN